MLATVRGARFVGLCWLGLWAVWVWADQPQPLAFHLSFSPHASAEPFTGRVFVMLSKRPMERPKRAPEWFATEPFFAWDVRDWKPGETLVLTAADALGYPMPLGQLPKGSWYVLAVMDFDRGSPNIGLAPGNVYSKGVQRDLDPQSSGPVSLHLDQVVPPPVFPESDRVKLVEIESRLLSEFHGRPTRLRAGVVLPKSYGQREGQRYPVLYDIPGFSGTHFQAVAAARGQATDRGRIEVIYVVPDPSCRWGHSVFADSDNNGPWGRAFVEELVPAVEQRFAAIGQPSARFLTGYSSGGWSSLWLQIRYPDLFGGVWSLAPDPVDFRDFQRIDIYAPGANAFTDDQGQPRPLARRQGMPILFFKPFSDMEEVMGHGGQLLSFEAVFSPRDPQGRPKPLWDRRTGKIDPEVARAWQRYDIRLILEQNWPVLGPKLAGKLHIYMGAEDTFYLDGAVVLLQQTLKRLGSDAVVELFPDRDHGNLLDRALRDRINNEIADQFLRHHPAP
jgi:S-formylglutathione hydrolase FrmB